MTNRSRTYKDLKDDGSTLSGCWIYCGVYQDDVNQAARRKPGHEQNWVAPEWGWAWPANRHIIHNRASADPGVRPWSERKRYVWWDEAERKWTGFDNPDFIDDRPPDYRPDKDARGLETIAGDKPFMMQARQSRPDPLQTPLEFPTFLCFFGAFIGVPRTIARELWTAATL